MQAHVFRVISLQNFDMMIAFFIVMNVFAMAVDSFKPSSGQQDFDMVANYFFSAVFGVECILKMVAFCPLPLLSSHPAPALLAPLLSALLAPCPSHCRACSPNVHWSV